ncbi:MAG: histidine phosphatase family protein [Phycisphaerales bacterium]|nr:histidine phosphatase family protein [Phycisphaerales bacterium]
MTDRVLHVLLLRHGVTDANLNGIVQGQSPVPLNAEGLEQSRRLAARIAQFKPKVQKLISSDLVRAMQTAGQIHRATSLAIEPDAGWRERGMGELEGHAADIWSAVKARDGMQPKGAETPHAHHQRVLEAFLRLPTQCAGVDCVAVVTHGGTMWNLLNMFNEGLLPLKAGHPALDLANSPNCGLTHLIGELSGGQWAWRVDCLNDGSHLATVTNRDSG